MTTAFDEFMRQYKLTGSEKADGYSRNVFIGLAEDEVETVFGLLENELPYSAEWLVFVAPERAMSVMKAREASLRKDAYSHTYLIQEELVRHSGDLAYQRHMIEDYPNYIDRLRPLVVSALGRTPQNKDTIAFFKQVILTETNESAVARAATGLLLALNVPRSTEGDQARRKCLESDLRGGDTDLKLRALMQIERANSLGAP